MYKKFCLFIIILLSLNCITSCGRRSQIRENMTNTDDTSTLDSNNNFYEDMTNNDLKELFNSNTVMESSCTTVVNTPYYYVLMDAGVAGGQAFNKLTNSFEYICKDSFCDHEACLFSWRWTQEQFCVYKDRIYMLASTEAYGGIDPTLRFCLYSADLLFHNWELEYEFPVSVESEYETYIGEEGDVGSDTQFICSVDDMAIYDNAVYCIDYYLDTDKNISPTIYKLDLKSKQYSIFLDNTYANSLELYDNILSWKNEDGLRVYYDLETGCFDENCIHSSADIFLPEDYFINGKLIGKNFGYVTVDHTTTMFTDDPFFTYYQSQKNNFRDIPIRRGGEIFRLTTNDAGETIIDLFVKLETDGVPDLIYWFYTDGITMLVKYETYLAFPNAYNNENVGIDLPGIGSIGFGNMEYKFALIDLNTGDIIKDIAILDS